RSRRLKSFFSFQEIIREKEDREQNLDKYTAFLLEEHFEKNIIQLIVEMAFHKIIKDKELIDLLQTLLYKFFETTYFSFNNRTRYNFKTKDCLKIDKIYYLDFVNHGSGALRWIMIYDVVIESLDNIPNQEIFVMF